MNEIAIIKKLQELRGTNLKKDFLIENKDNSRVLELLDIAHNPYTVLGLKKVEYSKGTLDKAYKNKYEEFINLVEYVLKYNTNNEVREKVTNFLNSCSEVEAEVYSQVLSKKLRLGINVKTINKALGYLLIPEFNLMLAEPEKGRNITFPTIVEEKYDGVRCLIIKDSGTVAAFTRQGRKLILPKLFKELESIKADDVVLDGELIKKGDRLKTTSVVNKILKGNSSGNLDEDLEFIAYDYMSLTAFNQQNCKNVQQQRSMFLQIFLNNNPMLRSFKKSLDRVCNTREEVLTFFKEVRSRGGEGLIIKNPIGLYEWKRSKNWIKIKGLNSATLEVVDIIEGEGKYVGMLGAITCRTSCGKLVTNVGSGFSDEDRELLWGKHTIGRFMEIKYINLGETEDGDYFFDNPVFLEARIDKEEADSLEKIIKETV